MLDLKSVRPIDAAIAVVAVLVLVIGAYLGYSMWTQRVHVTTATPAARAIDDLVSAVRKSPNDLDARLRLAQALVVAGRDRDAVKQYEAVLTVQKENTPALSGLGFLALKNKDYKTGERYYRKIVALLEGNVTEGTDRQLEIAYFYLGNALLEQKQFEEAAGYFKEALRLKRDASDTHYLLAVCFREMGSMDSYRESLENTVLFDPKHPEANLDLGKLLLEEDKVAEAAERFRKSADAAPAANQPQEALEALGTVEERIAKARKLMESDPKQAVIEARVAVALDPQSVEALVALGDARAATNSKKNAREAYERALGLEPDNAAAKAGLERVTNGSK